MRTLAADIRHAIRIYARTPAASVMAVIVLAIAMAFVGSFLSLYIDLVYKPNPGFEDSSRLVTIGQNDGTRISSMPYALFERIEEEVDSLQAVAGFAITFERVGADEEQRAVEMLSRNFFDGLRPRLALGRGFDQSDHDPESAPVAVLAHWYWLQEFGGSNEVLGQTVAITGRPQFRLPGPDGQPPEEPEDVTTEFRIVGVMHEALPSIQTEATAVFIPFEIGASLYLGSLEQIRTFGTLRALGRLADGATASAVAAELDSRYGDVDDMGLNPNEPFDAMTGLVLDINSQRDAKRQLQLFLAGSLLLALVAAANVSLFLLSRAPGRRRELGIRMAVGAPLRRLARQLATEAALLVVAATLLGVLAGFWLQTFLQGLSFLEGARWQSVSLFDWRVASLIVAFLVLLTLLVALAPVQGLKKLGISASAREVSTQANLTQRLACTAQIAIAGTVAAAALAFGWHLGLLITDDHGYDISDVHAVTVNEPGGFFVGDFSPLVEPALVERARRSDVILAQPWAEAIGFASSAPGMDDLVLRARLALEDAPKGVVEFGVSGADPGSFEILDLELLDGRFYGDNEIDVLVLNESAALEIFGRTDVVGETLPISLSDAETSEVIGVIADVSYRHPAAQVIPRAFLPVIPFPSADRILIRSALSTAEVREELQALIDAGDLEVELQDVRRLSDLMSELLAPDRARSWLTIGSATLVLILAGFGYYGTQRYLVSAGRREYAIRASLGAGPKALGRIVLTRGIGLGLPGVVTGALFAFIVTAWLRDEFVAREISPVLATAGVVAGICLLLLVAGLGPAAHARRTQPAPLLREE